MDYKSTLNLLKTEFPMKAGLAQREPQIQQFWNEIGLRPEVGVPIISVTARDSAALTRQLLKAGIYPCFIEYGGGPSPYFRFAISSAHTAEQIKRLARTLAASRKVRGKPELLFLGVDV